MFRSLVFILLLLVGCSPSLTFYTQQAPLLPVSGVKAVRIGEFAGQPGTIPMPSESNGLEKTIKPVILQFPSQVQTSNQVADLIRAMLVGGLAPKAPYRLINTQASSDGINGVVPDMATLGVIQAKVRYFEQTIKGSEPLTYVLMAVNNNVPFYQKVVTTIGVKGIVGLVESSGEGFQEQTPYIEQVAALEVEFEFLRSSDQSPIVPTQVIRAYYTQKWGGSSKTSHLPEKSRSVILEHFPVSTPLWDQLLSSTEKTSLRLNDPDEYLSKGYHLKQNNSVANNALDIKILLTKIIIDDYLKRILPYSQQQNLTISGGDAIAVTLLQGNAYEAAINRLESLPNRETVDTYHLGMAYEAMGEIYQAQKYYALALESSSDSLYQEALKRVQR